MTKSRDQTQLQYLITADHHQIAYALIGDPALTPILFLHGGPGANANPGDAKLFNPERHCVVMFDQRGCGKSTPTGDIKNNTTQHLIDDIEQLRRQLNIKHWRVYGGSWGAALALEYAKQHAEKVIDIILRGSFAARKQDLDWFIREDGVALQHPAAYAILCQQLQPKTNEALTSCLYRRLKEPSNAYAAALAWDHWEATVMGVPKASTETDTEQQQKRIASKLVYAHYCHHQFFLSEQGVLPGLNKLKDTPVTLIHGRNDQVCPLSAAQILDKALPNSTLITVDAGHSLSDTEIKRSLWNLVTH